VAAGVPRDKTGAAGWEREPCLKRGAGFAQAPAALDSLVSETSRAARFSRAMLAAPTQWKREGGWQCLMTLLC
jgi:hypothetical protein